MSAIAKVTGIEVRQAREAGSMLVLLGKDPVWGEEDVKRYDRGSAPVTGMGDGLPLDRILSDFNIDKIYLCPFWKPAFQ